VAARLGLSVIWATHADGRQRISDAANLKASLAAHRNLIFGKGVSHWTHRGNLIDRKTAEKVLNEQQGELPLAALLRCRVRYFTDGAILGSAEYVRGFVGAVQRERERKHPLKVNPLKGAAWGDMAVIQSLRREIFS
jgi:hypothetical protein